MATEELHRIQPPSRRVRYPTAEAAEAAPHAWSREQGVVLARQRFYTNKSNVIVQRLFACSCARKPMLIDEAQRQRQRQSRKVGCPMRIKISADDVNIPKGERKIVHTRDGSKVHNHPPDKSMRGRRTASRALSGDQSFEYAVTDDESGAEAEDPMTQGEEITPESPSSGLNQPQQRDIVATTLVVEPRQPLDQSMSVETHSSQRLASAVRPGRPDQEPPITNTAGSVRVCTWPAHRPPLTDIVGFRDRVYNLFGKQPVPLHVVESVAMKEMIYALRPTMLPYLPTAHETQEEISIRCRGALRLQTHQSQ